MRAQRTEDSDDTFTFPAGRNPTPGKGHMESPQHKEIEEQVMLRVGRCLEYTDPGMFVE